MRTINKIIIHCTATDNNCPVDRILKYHLSLGFSDFGYHYLIDSNGIVLSGRPVDQIGAHCKGQNKDSIGIALIGGKDGKFDFTFSQLNSLFILVTKLKFKYEKMFHNVITIHGHNEFNKNKACPNFNVKNFFAYED